MSDDSALPLTPAGGSSFYVPAHGSGEIVPLSLEDRHSSISTPREETHSSKEAFEAIASSRRARRPIRSFHDDTEEGRNQAWAARDDFEFLLVDPNADHVLSPPRRFKHLLRPCPRKPGSGESITSASHRHQLTWFQPSEPMPFDIAAEFGGFDASRDPSLCVQESESESLFVDRPTDKSGYLPSFLPDLESAEITGSPVRLSMKPLHPNRDIRSDVTCSTVHWNHDPTESLEGMPVSLWTPILPWSHPTSYTSTPEALRS